MIDSATLLSHLRALRLLVLDVDGTLTDGRVGLDGSGRHLRHFFIKDGIMIRRLKDEGLPVGIISHSTHQKAIQERADMLYISKCYVGKAPKDEVLMDWCRELDILPKHVAVIGDDVNDVPLFRCCGHSACPSDASLPIQQIADIVLSYKGGYGAVREWVEHYFLVAKHWPAC